MATKLDRLLEEALRALGPPKPRPEAKTRPEPRARAVPSDPLDAIKSEDWEYLPKVIMAELPSVIERAIKAGARPPLSFLGAGMYGVVLADSRAAYKVARHKTPENLASIRDEAEWLRVASRAIPTLVARYKRHYPQLGVLVRECVKGRPGGWGASAKTQAADKAIREAMSRHDYSGPEYKDDSYILDEETGRAKLVDASSTHMIGDRLLAHVESVLRGEVPFAEKLSDLAFYVRSDLLDPKIKIDRPRAERVLDLLRARGVKT